MKKLLYSIVALLLLNACEEPVGVGGDTPQVVTPAVTTSLHGFYLLNEGNMGSNKATLDYFDFATGSYSLNIYTQANPSVPMELGDVGNDLKKYGARLYAVINASNKVEVMDLATAKRIRQIDVANCRYIAFHEEYAYLTSYAGPIQLYPQYEQKGYVLKIDTLTMQVVDTCLVGFQPDELAVVDGKIYVANSGGYLSPNYENTLSVIDIETFEELQRVVVDVNLHRVRVDQYGMLWVSSRGDYRGNASRIFCVDPQLNKVIDSLDVPCSNMCIVGDSLYYCASEFDYAGMTEVGTCGMINVKTRTVLTKQLLPDDVKLVKPYGIMVNPQTNDLYLTDARDCVTPGILYCFDKDGKMKWKTRTGDIPAHFVLW